MRHGILAVPAAAALATAGLTTGCANGGGTTGDSPGPTRSIDRSGTRGASASAERDRTPEGRDTGSRTPDSRPSEKTVTRTAEATETVKERETRTATATRTETEVAQPAGADSPSPEESSGTSSLLWLFVLFAAVVAGLVAWLVHTTRKRSQGERDWNLRAAEACAQGTAVRDAVRAAMLLAPGPAVGARWIDVQRAADDLTRKLSPRDTAPTDEDRLRVDDVLTALRTLRPSMTVEPPPGTERTARHGNVQADLHAFDDALGALRAGAVVR